MKYFLIPLIALTLPALSAELDPARQSVQDHFRSSAEPTAIDALWTDEHVFKVGVRDDGSDRSGFGQYVCMMIYDAGLKGERVLVRVIDYPRLVNNDEWINLGTAQCQ